MRLIQVNITALAQLTKLYVKDMVRRGSGRILNVGSTAAFVPGPLMAMYYASKAFVVSFSEALSKEFEGTGVTVTVLCPGPTTHGIRCRGRNHGQQTVSRFRHDRARKSRRSAIAR